MNEKRVEKEEFAPRPVENAVSAEDIAKARAEKLAKLKAAKDESDTDKTD